MTPVRRRGLLLLCFALVCGGLAASQVRERERRAEAAIGPLAPVVVAARSLPADRALEPGDLEVRRMPARFVPPDAVAAAGSLAGLRTAAPIAAGGYLTAGVLQGAEPRRRGGGPLRPGQRAVELGVAGGAALAGFEPGTRVDVLVSAQGDGGGGRTYAALEDVELLGLRAGGEELAGDDARAAGGEPLEAGSDGSEPGALAGGALASLRVSARQAVYLIAAANFAQEVRLLVRPPGDRRRIGAGAASAADF